MQGKNIKTHLRNKILDWAESVDDNPEVKEAILKDVLITGGAIVSLLQDEKPHDYDCYFRNIKSLKLVADYYVDKFVEKSGGVDALDKPKVQRCYWGTSRTGKDIWAVLKGNETPPNGEEERLRVFIRSIGAVGDNYNHDLAYQRAMAKLNNDAKKKRSESKDKPTPYSPIFLTNNAISLTSDIQVVLRFYGEPDKIHDNYDFVHCTSYWTSWNNKLVMPTRALEAIINKELYYIGSKYPLCSIIRTRKFINRGWNVNAGQYLKMVLQLNDMDLKNLHVFEEQLIGVDSAYFNGLICAVRRMKENNPDFVLDSGYLINLVNDIFDDGVVPGIPNNDELLGGE